MEGWWGSGEDFYILVHTTQENGISKILVFHHNQTIIHIIDYTVCNDMLKDKRTITICFKK